MVKHPKSLKKARPTPWVARQLPIMAVLAVFLVLAVVLSFLCDDAFITFRYAANLAHGHGAVYNIGEKVEGYTNFLWMILMAIVITLGGDPEFWSRFLSILSSAGLLWLLFRWWSARHGHDPRLSALMAAFLALSAPFIVWSTGGLETALFSLLLLASLMGVIRTRDDGSVRTAVVSGLLAALAILTRPEGLLFAGASTVYLALEAIGRKRRIVPTLAFLIPLVLIVGGHWLWRFSFYGKALPNTFYIKAPAVNLLPFGFDYLLRFIIESGLWFPVIAVVYLLVRGRTFHLSRRNIFLTVLFTLFLAWVVYTGGDFMAMGRFLVPILGVCFLVLSELSSSPLQLNRKSFAVVFALLVLQGGYSAYQLRKTYQIDSGGTLDSIGRLADYRHSWTVVGKLLGQIALPTDTMVTSAAGIIPYYSHLYTIDLLGLTAPNLALYRPHPEHVRPGHNLSLKPDAFFDAMPQFFLGHPRVSTMDSDLFGMGTLEDSADRLVRYYDAAAIPLVDEPGHQLLLFLRKDVPKRLPVPVRIYK